MENPGPRRSPEEAAAPLLRYGGWGITWIQDSSLLGKVLAAGAVLNPGLLERTLKEILSRLDETRDGCFVIQSTSKGGYIRVFRHLDEPFDTYVMIDEELIHQSIFSFMGSVVWWVRLCAGSQRS
jgi:hypothetical protein